MLIRLASFIMLSTLSLAPAISAQAGDWSIDPAHSNAHFTVRHMMVSNVSGDFGKISGQVNYDGKHLDKAAVEAVIDATTIDTREPKRDAHLKGPDFLDVGKFPTMSFKSKRIVVLPDGRFKLIGDLTLHGVTKEVVLTADAPASPVKDPFGKIRMGASATTKINRKDFGISFNMPMDNGGVVVGDDVAVTLDVELKQGS